MSLAIGALAAGITAAATGGSSIYGAHKSSSAANKAAQLQLTSTREALDYTKTHDAQERADALAAQKANYDQYVQSEARKAPYRATGAGANQTLARLLGLPKVDIAPPPPAPAYLTQPTMGTLLNGTVTGGPSPSAPTSAAAPHGASGMVLIQAPNGATKQVPQNQAAQYLAKGAKVLNAR